MFNLYSGSFFPAQQASPFCSTNGTFCGYGTPWNASAPYTQAAFQQPNVWPGMINQTINPSSQTINPFISGTLSRWNQPIHSYGLNPFAAIGGYPSLPTYGANFGPFGVGGYSCSQPCAGVYGQPSFIAGQIPVAPIWSNQINPQAGIGGYPMNSTPGAFGLPTPATGLGLNGGFPTSTSGTSPIVNPCRCPLVNVWESDSKLHIEAEVPGVNLDDVDLQVVGNTLYLKTGRVIHQSGDNRNVFYAERQPVGFVRAINLPVAIDCDKVDAKLNNGILCLTLPKAASQQHRTIRVGHLAAA